MTGTNMLQMVKNLFWSKMKRPWIRRRDQRQRRYIRGDAIDSVEEIIFPYVEFCKNPAEDKTPPILAV